MDYSFYRRLIDLEPPFVTQTELKHLLGGTDDSRFAKVKRAMADGWLVRIRRGLYAINDKLTKRWHPFALADRVYGPSVISLESAMSYHGLIPEAVFVITSVTARRRNYFKTPVGDFSYMSVPQKRFMTSVERIVDGENVYLMASPWRAIADYVYCYKKNWDTIEPLFEDLRMDEEDLPILLKEEAESLTHYFNNKRVTKFLFAALRRLR